MINGLFGRPRSGKSYEATRYHIIKALEEGRQVVTNIPLNVKQISIVYGEEVEKLIQIVKTNFADYGNQRPFSTPEDFTKFDWKNEQGQGPLFVIDECHLCLGREAKTPVVEYLSMHGHYGHDILLLSQSPRKIHRDVKDMVEISWRCVKKSIYGEDKGYIQKTYHGVSTSNSDFIKSVEREYDPAFFRFYKSHTLSAISVDEGKAGVNASRVPHRKLFIGMIVVGALLAIFTGKRMMTGNTHIEKKPEITQQKKQDVETVKSVTINDPDPMQSPSTSPAQEEIAQPRKAQNKTLNEQLYDYRSNNSKQFHPFYKVSLHIASSYTLGDFNNPVRRLGIVASQNGQQVFTLNSSDLIAAGYTVEIYADCSALIRYFEYEDFITCDSPSMTVSTAF